MFRVIVITASGSVHIRGVPRIVHCGARLKGQEVCVVQAVVYLQML